MIQELLAAISKSLSSLGGVRTSANEGSMILRNSFTIVLFADPCSPWRIRIGYGPLGRQVGTSQETQRIQLASSPTVIKFLSMVIEPAGAGAARGGIPF